MATGWIKLHKKMLDWDWWQDQDAFRLWVTILLKANYEDDFWRGIPVKRGSFIASKNSLAKTTGLSESTIRRTLKRLTNSGEIDIQTTNKYSVITVINWEQHQGDDKQTTNKQHTNDKQSDVKKTTVKEERNNKQEVILASPKKGKENAKTGKRIENAININETIPTDWFNFTSTELKWDTARIEHTFQDFKDYWLAKSGKDASKLDWLATWRRWCRNQRDSTSSSNAKRSTATTVFNEVVAERKRRRESGDLF